MNPTEFSIVKTDVNISVIESLKPLFAESRRKGLWFHCRYEGLWFSPDELESLQQEGRFRWGPPVWELRCPRERLAELEGDIRKAEEKADQFRCRLEQWESSHEKA